MALMELSKEMHPFILSWCRHDSNSWLMCAVWDGVKFDVVIIFVFVYIFAPLFSV